MKRIFLACFMLLQTCLLYAGDKPCNCTIEDIEKEASYLAKKILEVTGEKQYTLEKPPTFKAAFGACLEVTEHGVKLNCITPDLDPQKKGMAIGDVITSINGLGFVSGDKLLSHKRLHSIIDHMKPGDILQVTFNREKQQKTVDIEVGKITHPGFTFKVSR